MSLSSSLTSHHTLSIFAYYLSVQLRPTVRSMGKALEFDKSLFERLYTGPSFEKLTRTMLEVCFQVDFL